MKLKDYFYTGKEAFKLSKMPTCASLETVSMKEEWLERTQENLDQLSEWQSRLYADGREGLLVVLQGMDTAGKDSLVRHVFTCMDPQGVHVHAFKQPTAQELSHDYLWRVVSKLPACGEVAVFNRSHYEDVVAVSVLKLYEHFKRPERCVKGDVIEKRLEEIRAFEAYLHNNGTRVVKFFLNVSEETQKKRLLERIERPEKNWKFDPSDLDNRALWPAYQAAYERAILATATEDAPWYVIPADNKWLTRYLVSEALCDVLASMAPSYPEMSDAQRAALPGMQAKLLKS